MKPPVATSPVRSGAANHAAPADQAFTYQTITDNALVGATSMAFAPDGRLFVCERLTGNIRVIQDGALLPGNWATVPCTTSTTGDHGLMGIAIDPGFLTNGYVYVYYTTQNQLENCIARLQDGREPAGSQSRVTRRRPSA